MATETLCCRCKRWLPEASTEFVGDQDEPGDACIGDEREACLESQLEETREQLAEARKDTERLDWLSALLRGGGAVDDWTVYLPRTPEVAVTDSDENVIAEGADLRAAIDAARKEGPNGDS